MKIQIVILCFCMMCMPIPEAKSQDDCRYFDGTVKVMSRNMYPGADLGLIAGADADHLQDAVQATMESVIQSRIPRRARQIAAEIGKNKPDLVALQEATRWKFKYGNRRMVLDQLDLLMEALQRAGEHYKVAVVQNLTDIRIPDLISYSDHDIILVRVNPQLKILGTETRVYDALMSFPAMGGEIEVLRGWASAEVKKNGCRFKFVNTHLEAPLEGVHETQDLQLAQAAQLVDDLYSTRLPVIVAGDFNTDAEPTQGYPPDETGSYDLVLNSGYADAWHDVHANDPVYDFGYTWPLFWEDSGEVSDPIERIDLVFLRGFEAVSMIRTGTSPTHGLYASDHAGIVATLRCIN